MLKGRDQYYMINYLLILLNLMIILFSFL